jgi:hypothetical protein
MEIRSESRIHYPREQVYRAYRDRLPDIASYIPDVREIKVLSREEGDATLRLHNEWIAHREIPQIASSILRPEHLRWDDFATWHDGAFYCDWEIKPRAFTDAVRCKGRNTFVADGDATLVRLTGDLQIDLREIPGVPGFLGKRLAPQVEKFIVSLITPNLKATNESIQAFLDAEGA